MATDFLFFTKMIISAGSLKNRSAYPKTSGQYGFRVSQAEIFLIEVGILRKSGCGQLSLLSGKIRSRNLPYDLTYRTGRANFAGALIAGANVTYDMPESLIVSILKNAESPVYQRTIFILKSGEIPA